MGERGERGESDERGERADLSSLADLAHTHGCERILKLQVPAAKLVGFVAIHSTRRGPAFGGIRRRSFESEAAAVSEVVELATAMSQKCALAGLPAGGAKTVILDHPHLNVDAAYDAVGRAVAALDGAYVCGPDVGTGTSQLERVRARTCWVNPSGNDAGASTARGVLAGLRGVLSRLDGQTSFGGRDYLVQGLGAVGIAAAQVLVRDGGRVVGADPSPGAIARAQALGVKVIAPETVVHTTCDVWLPCAFGHVLGEAVAREVPCRAVCGSANNQLAPGRAAQILQSRGILHAPDVVVSAGAVIEGVLTVLDKGPDIRARVEAAIDRIEFTVGEIMSRSGPGQPPSRVARDMARDLLH